MSARSVRRPSGAAAQNVTRPMIPDAITIQIRRMFPSRDRSRVAATRLSTRAALRTPHPARRTQHPVLAHCIEPGRTLPRLSSHGHLPARPSAGFPAALASTRVHGHRGDRARARNWREHGRVLAGRLTSAEAAIGHAGRRAGRRLLARSHAARCLSRILVSELCRPAGADRPLPVAHRAYVRAGWHGRRRRHAARVRQHHDREFLRDLRRPAAPWPNVLR